MTKTTITALHVERGRAMRAIIEHDITRKGLSFEEACQALADHLEIDVKVVKLALAIANDADAGGAMTAKARAEMEVAA